MYIIIIPFTIVT